MSNANRSNMYSGGHLCLFEIDKSEPIHFNQKEEELRYGIGNYTLHTPGEQRKIP